MIDIIANESNIDLGGENIDESLRDAAYNINVNNNLFQAELKSFQI